MIKLTREIRFNLVDQNEADSTKPPEINNSWGGWPSATQLSPYLELQASVVGRADPITGYLCNIKNIDSAVRDSVIQSTIACPELNEKKSAISFLRIAWHHLNQCEFLNAQLCELTLKVTPTLRYQISIEESNVITLTQQFEFSAAHRLHVASMSDKENRDYFGKCNNANGHGHNYVIDVTINTPDNSDKISLNDFESIVKSKVIDVLDHKHLNQDVEYFHSVNPTVENIAIAIWQWLDQQIPGATLRNIRVYETPKTWADYSAG